jgi:two-component system, NtrC family, nitrogen regulation sensor histidine kinase NtrY
MKIRTKYTLFIAVIHLAALSMSYFIFRENKLLFLLIECVILVSLALSWSLYKDLIRPIEMLAGGVEAIRDRDFSVKLVHTGAREMDGLVEVYNQMMDQLRRERVLQQEQHFFLDKLLETAPVGALILDFEGQPESLNPRGIELLGLPRPMPHQKPHISTDHPLWPAIAQLVPGQSTIIQTDSAKKFKLSKAKFIDRGFPRAFVLIEELTAELLAAEKKAYGKVIRMMAHEVNNSVGAVNSILDTARQLENDPVLANALAVAVERNEHLSQFMRHFADVIRLPEPRRERFDLHELLRKTAILMEYMAAQRGIVFQFDLAPLPLFIAADMQQMEQLLINVLKNAIEAIDGQGIVLIRTMNKPSTLHIIDNGKGIPPEVAPLLFSPFFSNKNGGQGVGLTLVREILLQHQFAFSLQTVANGTTVFEVILD